MIKTEPWAYGAAIVFPALALTAQHFIYLKIGGTPSPFLLEYPAVFYICWVWGRGPGLVSTLVSAVGAWYHFFPPYNTFQVPHAGDALKLGVFTVMGVLFSTLIPASLEKLKSLNRDLERLAFRSKTLLRSAADGIHILDARGNVLEANDAFCRMLGYTHDEVLKLNVAQWDAKWSAEELEKQVLPRLLKEMTVFETKQRRRDGQMIDVEVSATGVEIDGQRLLFAASRDITERKQMESTLRLQQAKIEGILRGAPVGIAEFVNRVFTLANDRLCQTLGYSPGELIGMPARNLYLSDQEYERIGRIFYGDPAAADTTSAEVQFRRKDGRIIDVLLNMTPLYRDNPDAGAIFVIVDITERKRAAAELKRYANELEEANRLKDIFTDVLRHDILNPVSAIRSSAELLLRGETDPRKTKVLQNIQKSTSNLMEMTENAAKLAKVATARDMEFSPRDLNGVLRDVLHDFGPQLKERNVTIGFAPAGERWADVNPMIKDVFSNLISNAIKYGPANNRIEMDIEDGADFWVISVKDHGEGISDANKERIFNRFERIGKQGVKGSGLGLTITAQIVSMHGGKIWVEDNPEGGCIFRVRLPKKQGLLSRG